MSRSDITTAHSRSYLKRKLASMPLGQVVRRILLLGLVIWAAATINFFLPRMATGRDPIREKLSQLAATGGLRQEGIEEMVKAYQAKFGLDKPLGSSPRRIASVMSGARLVSLRVRPPANSARAIILRTPETGRSQEA